MTTTDKNISKFMTLFHAFENALNGEKDNPYHEWRRSAIDRLQHLSFPRRKDEDWKYTPVTRIVTPNYSVPTKGKVSQEQLDATRIPNFDGVRLVFVNCQLRKEFSDWEDLPQGLTVMNMNEAFQQPAIRQSIEKLLTDNTEYGKDPFVTLNTAFSMENRVFHVQKNTKMDRPIHFVYLNTEEDQPYFANPQKLFLIEEGAEASFVESFQSTAPNRAEYFNNIVNRFQLGANARVHHYKMQNESRAGFQINNTEIFQGRDSVYSNYTADLGGRMVRNNLSAYQKGENATTNLYGGFMGRDQQHFDSHTLVDHAIPHCQSNELYKGILTDSARGVFNGKVVVHKDAQKTNAFQQNSSLLLSDKAVMDAKPQLEIFADDVKCSHGATIGQLDEDSVFYLRSRGLTDQKAREALQNAFLLEVMERIPNPALKQYMADLITQKFEDATTIEAL